MNARSLAANAAVTPNKRTQRDQILTAFYVRGVYGAFGEEVTRPVLGLTSDNTGTARLAELKGISLGHPIQLVRTGETRTTQQGCQADVLVHWKFATPAQIAEHIQWIKDERQKEIEQRERRLTALRNAPEPKIFIERPAGGNNGPSILS